MTSRTSLRTSLRPFVVQFAIAAAAALFAVNAAAQDAMLEETTEATEQTGGQLGDSSGGDLDAIIKSGVLRVGVAEITPWFLPTGLGDFVGYEVESTAALAEHLGVERVFVVEPFADLADGLAAGRFDIIASGYSITERRNETTEFSLPYNRTAYKLVISKEKAGARSRVRDFNNKQFSIGYLEGGLSEKVARANFPKAELRGFAARADALRALVAGEMDGFVGSDPFYTAVVRARPEAFTVPVDEPLAMSIEAFAMREGETALADAVNAWVISAERAGAFKKLHARWFDELLSLSVIAELSRKPPEPAPAAD